MPTPERIAFFTANKDEMNTIIVRENSQRNKNRMEPLSEEEIDLAIDEIMQHKAAGKSILKYKFAPGTTPKADDPSESREPASIQSSNSKRFEVLSCENGFVLKFGATSFIFRTPKELMKIFDGVLFKKDNKDATPVQIQA